MLTLRPTKMLARRLGLTLPAVPPPVNNRVADWCAHGFSVGRTRYMIFCHTGTLFPVVTYARGVRDDGDLIGRFAEALILNLAGGPFEFHYQRWIAPELAEVQWAPVPDRAVLGSINDLVFAAKYSLTNRDEAPVELSAWLAKTPMKILGGQSPDLAFPTLMS